MCSIPEDESVANGVAPSFGYLLPKWDNGRYYRATALAYMEREGEACVEHVNGNTYSLACIKSSIIGSNYEK